MKEKLNLSPEQMYWAATDVAPSHVFTLRRARDDGKGGVICREEKIRIQALSKHEELEALAKAQEFAKGRGLPGYGDVYREAQSLEALTYAVRELDASERPDGSKYYPRKFTSLDHLASSFNSMEVAALLNFYESLMDKYRSLESLEDADIELWIDRLTDPMRAFDFLAQLSFADARDLLVPLAIRAKLAQQSGPTTPDDSQLGSESVSARSDRLISLSFGRHSESLSTPSDPVPTDDGSDVNG